MSKPVDVNKNKSNPTTSNPVVVVVPAKEKNQEKEQQPPEEEEEEIIEEEEEEEEEGEEVAEEKKESSKEVPEKAPLEEVSKEVSKEASNNKESSKSQDSDLVGLTGPSSGSNTSTSTSTQSSTGPLMGPLMGPLTGPLTGPFGPTGCAVPKETKVNIEQKRLVDGINKSGLASDFAFTAPEQMVALETTWIQAKDIHQAVNDACVDLQTCYKFVHRPTDTPLFLDIQPVTKRGKMYLVWKLRFVDPQNHIHTFKTIRQEVVPTIHQQQQRPLVTIRCLNSYPPTNITHEIAADFLVTLQRSFSTDIQVTKLKPTQTELAFAKSQTEKKEAEMKAMTDRYLQALESYKQLEKKEAFESGQCPPVGLLPFSEVDPSSIIPTDVPDSIDEEESIPATINRSSIPKDRTKIPTTTPSLIQNQGSKMFQDSKLKEQIAIIYNHVVELFQPVGGYIEKLSDIILIKSLFAVTDIQYAFENSYDDIKQKNRIMIQMTPIHVHDRDQLWIRLGGPSDDELIEVNRESFGLFLECKLSQNLQRYTINRLFPLFRSTDARKQKSVNATIEVLMQRIDTSLQEFFQANHLVDNSTSTFVDPSLATNTNTKTKIKTKTTPTVAATATATATKAKVIPQKPPTTMDLKSHKNIANGNANANANAVPSSQQITTTPISPSMMQAGMIPPSMMPGKRGMMTGGMMPGAMMSGAGRGMMPGAMMPGGMMPGGMMPGSLGRGTMMPPTPRAQQGNLPAHLKKQRGAEIDLASIVELPQGFDNSQQSLYSDLPQNPVARFHPSLLRRNRNFK